MKQSYYLFFLLLLPVLASAHPGNRPLEFIENRGQWPGAFLYRASVPNGELFLEKNAISYVIGAPENNDKVTGIKTGSVKGPTTLYFHKYRMSFVGGSLSAEVTGDKPQTHYYNYYLGNDTSKWKSGIHPNLAVDYHQVYPGIDMHISTENQGIKYDLIVQPGADIGKILLKYEGPDGMEIKDGKLLVHTSVGTIEELAPFAYQYINGERIELSCRYKLKNNIISYSFPKGYNKELPLVIDPTVRFATYSGSSWDNWGYTATYDAQGNFYTGGITGPASQGTYFDTTTGAYQTKYGGPQTGGQGHGYPCDMAIHKYNSNGNTLLFGTFLGGKDVEQPHSMIVDLNNNLIIAGRSYSDSFPTTPGCYDNTNNGSGDLVISKLNSTGTILLASTYVGGAGEDMCNNTPAEFLWGGLKHNYGDDARSEVNVDKQGNIYVAGCTRSANFPTSGAIKTTLGSGDAQDGVVLKMNPTLTSMIWGTYLGGGNEDAAYVIALDTSQNQLFVAGGTMSSDFPTTSGVWHNTFQGNPCDGFLCRFQNGGSYTMQRSSFIGAGGYDQCYGVQVDLENNVYVMGQTMGGGYTVTSGVYSQPNSSQFVTKLDNNINGPLASTVFGSGNSSATNISPVAFLVDTCQNVYISGWGGDIYTSSNATPPPGTGTTTGMLPSPIPWSGQGPVQSTTDGKDFYFIVFAKNLVALQYATYMGGTGNVPEHVDGGTSRFDKNGVVYQAICGGCNNSPFPTTPGAYRTTNGSINCNMVSLKIEFNFGAVKATANANPNKIVCLGSPVSFSSAGTFNATSFEWDFGDGSPINTNPNPTYTYTSAGTFQVRLIGINPNACKVRDTVYLTIKVDTVKIKAGFNINIIDSCINYVIGLSNTSKYGNPPSGTSFLWKFGDPGNTTSTLANPPNFTYPQKGTYTITLIETDANACNSPDSVSKTVTFNSFLVKSGFNFQDVCEGDTTFFNESSSNAQSIKWTIGDSTFTKPNPHYIFDSAGVYRIKLVAYNPLSCNKADSAEHDIIVNPVPKADFAFTYDHEPAQTNDTVHFHNKSLKADSYNWNFGDLTGSQETDPSHFYKRTGTYNVCLISSNKQGCSDTICKPVYVDILPLADIPTGFSPNGDGVNDILYVRGAAIETLNLKIFNRWGQLVFESNAQKDGWDGTFKGKPQEMDAYAFVLNVRFIDETTLYKKGNVTLLR